MAMSKITHRIVFLLQSFKTPIIKSTTFLTLSLKILFFRTVQYSFTQLVKVTALSFVKHLKRFFLLLSLYYLIPSVCLSEWIVLQFPFSVQVEIFRNQLINLQEFINFVSCQKIVDKFAILRDMAVIQRCSSFILNKLFFFCLFQIFCFKFKTLLAYIANPFTALNVKSNVTASRGALALQNQTYDSMIDLF